MVSRRVRQYLDRKRFVKLPSRTRRRKCSRPHIRRGLACRLLRPHWTWGFQPKSLVSSGCGYSPPLPLKVKAETDQYLRELEFQGRAEDVYGKGVQLLSPTPALVLKSKVLPQKGATASGDVANDACLPVGQKVFINVCTSDKVRRLGGLGLRDAGRV